MKWLLAESEFEKYKYHKNTFDCDDFSLILHAFVRQEQYRRKDWKNPWAFGEAWGNKFKGELQEHAVNIALTKKEILLIEPQTDEIWTANPDNDNIYFVRM